MIVFDNLDKHKNQHNWDFVNIFVAEQKYAKQIEQIAQYFENKSQIKHKIIEKYGLVCLQVAPQDCCFAVVVGLQVVTEKQLNDIYLITANGKIVKDPNQILSRKEKEQLLNENIKEKIQKQDNSPFLEN